MLNKKNVMGNKYRDTLSTVRGTSVSLNSFRLCAMLAMVSLRPRGLRLALLRFGLAVPFRGEHSGAGSASSAILGNTLVDAGRLGTLIPENAEITIYM